MCCANDSVNMDNGKVVGIVVQERQLDHPHPGQLIWLILNIIEPVDKRAWIRYTVSAWQWEKGDDACDFHPLDALMRVRIHEHCVIAFWATKPRQRCFDLLMACTANTTGVTWRNKGGSSGMIDFETAGKHCWMQTATIQVELLGQEVPKEVREIRSIKFFGQ